MKTNDVLNLFLIFSFIFFNLTNVFLHESIHYAVYDAGGCRDIEFGFNIKYAYVECLDVENYDKSYDYYNLMNEIIGYYFQIFMNLILVGFFIFLNKRWYDD
jgi:hypothetical protein